MSTKNIGAAERESCRAVGRPEALASCYVHRSPFDLIAPLCRSLVAINATWVGLANQRVRENARLSRELASCTSVPAMLRAYSTYCQAAVRQYQSGLTDFQQITVQLMREGPVGSLMPAEAAVEIQDHSMRRSGRATDGALQ